MRKIILLCAQGMSTSLLMEKMRAAAKEQSYEMNVDAFPVSKATTVAADADVILLGPQVRYDLEKVQKECPGVPAEPIDMRAYGMMDGAAVIKRVREILGD